MALGYRAEVIADSVNPQGNRIITIELRFPHIILPQVNTHKSISKSASSARAQPRARRINEVSEEPWIPESWGEDQRGMVAGEELPVEGQAEAERAWREAARSAVDFATKLADIGVHKEVTNRLLEPFSWQTTVMTGNVEFFDHLVRLRKDVGAQPQFQILAQLIDEAIEESSIMPLGYDDWHLPYINAEEYGEFDLDDLKRISVARCARTSYGRQNSKDARSDLQLYEMLLTQEHWSPFEMVCRPKASDDSPLGNIHGWHQLRHEYEDVSYYP